MRSPCCHPAFIPPALPSCSFIPPTHPHAHSSPPIARSYPPCSPHTCSCSFLCPLPPPHPPCTRLYPFCAPGFLFIDKRAMTLDGFSRIFHNFIRFNIHILSDRNRMTPTHSHIVTRFDQAYRSIPNDFRRIALGRLDQIRYAAPPRTGTGETIDVIVRNQ